MNEDQAKSTGVILHVRELTFRDVVGSMIADLTWINWAVLMLFAFATAFAVFSEAWSLVVSNVIFITLVFKNMIDSHLLYLNRITIGSLLGLLGDMNGDIKDLVEKNRLGIPHFIHTEKKKDP